MKKKLISASVALGIALSTMTAPPAFAFVENAKEYLTASDMARLKRMGLDKNANWDSLDGRLATMTAAASVLVNGSDADPETAYAILAAKHHANPTDWDQWQYDWNYREQCQGLFCGDKVYYGIYFDKEPDLSPKDRSGLKKINSARLNSMWDSLPTNDVSKIAKYTDRQHEIASCKKAKKKKCPKPLPNLPTDWKEKFVTEVDTNSNWKYYRDEKVDSIVAGLQAERERREAEAEKKRKAAAEKKRKAEEARKKKEAEKQAEEERKLKEKAEAEAALKKEEQEEAERTARRESLSGRSKVLSASLNGKSDEEAKKAGEEEGSSLTPDSIKAIIALVGLVSALVGALTQFQHYTLPKLAPFPPR